MSKRLWLRNTLCNDSVNINLYLEEIRVLQLLSLKVLNTINWDQINRIKKYIQGSFQRWRLARGLNWQINTTTIEVRYVFRKGNYFYLGIYWRQYMIIIIIIPTYTNVWHCYTYLKYGTESIEFAKKYNSLFNEPLIDKQCKSLT